MIELAKNASKADKVTLVKSVAQSAILRRSDLMDRMLRNWDLYIGKHWIVNPPRGHEKVVLNYTGTLLENLVSFLTGANPEFEPWPMDGSHYSEDIYKIANRLMKSWWHRQGMAQEIDVFVRNVAIYGLGMSAIAPPAPEKPDPDMIFDNIDPFNCCFDLNSRHWDFQRGEFFLLFYLDDRRKMEKEFGVEIAQGSDYLDDLRLWRQTETAPLSSPKNMIPGFGSYQDGPGGDYVSMSENLNMPRTQYEDKDECVVMRLYFRDNTMVDRERSAYVNIGGSMERVSAKVSEQKYPGGIRVITVCGDTLCEDAASPYQKGYWRDKFPFMQCNFIRRPDSPYGIGFPDRLEDVQMQLNFKTSLLYDWLSQLPKTPLIVPQGIGINVAKIATRTGLVLQPKNALLSKYIRFLQTPSVSPAAVEAIRELLIHMERIGGIPDVSEGRRPTGITAASAIIALQEKAKQKFQHQVRNVEGFLSDLGNGVLGGMEQYYVIPQPYYGFDDMGSPELLRYGGSAEISPAMLLANGRHRVRVRAASTLEVSRYALEERYMQLHGLGIITDEQLVEGLEMPGKERIVNDLQRRKLLAELMMQADALLGQGGGAAGAPPAPSGGAPASNIPRQLAKPTTERNIVGGAQRREQGMRAQARARG